MSNTNAAPTITQRMGAWWRALWAQPHATRVGMLDTGELVLVMPNGAVQTLSPHTVALVGNALAERQMTQRALESYQRHHVAQSMLFEPQSGGPVQ